MEVRLSHHGIERLFERVYKKAQSKTLGVAESFIQKVLERGSVEVNDKNQLLVVYANNLYIFKKEIMKMHKLVFVTVKTCQEYRLSTFFRGEKQLFSSKKNFSLCA